MDGHDTWLNRGFDAGFEGENLAVRCAYERCGVSFEDHYDEALGHPFVMPEPDDDFRDRD